MSGWLLRSIIAVGDNEYDVRFLLDGRERTFRFSAQWLAPRGGEGAWVFSAGEFESETIYSRPALKAVVKAVSAFHQACAEPVLLAPPGQPPTAS